MVKKTIFLVTTRFQHPIYGMKTVIIFCHGWHFTKNINESARSVTVKFKQTM